MKRSRKLAALGGTAVALGAIAVTAGITATDPGEQRAAAPAAAAAAATWPLVQGTPQADSGTVLSGIATAPDGTVWAAGSKMAGSNRAPLLQRLNGDTWVNVTLPAALNRYSLGAAAATSQNDLWVAGRLAVSGDTHGLLHWNGKAWRTFQVPYAFQPADIAAADTRNAWAVSTSAAKHWNGTAWADTPIGIKPRAVTAVSAADAWAVGWAGDQPATAHWNGKAWATVPFPKIDGVVRGEIAPTLHDVHANSSNDVWAVGSVRVTDAAGKSVSRSLFAHWNGTKWTNVLGEPGSALTEINSDGAGGIWVHDGRGTMRHRTADGTWTSDTLAQPAGTSIVVGETDVRPGSTTVWAVGYTSTDATGYADLAHWRSN